MGDIEGEVIDEFRFKVFEDEETVVRMSMLTRFEVFSMRASLSSQARASTAGIDGAAGLPAEVEGLFTDAPDEAGLFDFAAH